MIDNYNYYTHNWWKIELDELPTKGIFYNKNTIIKVRALTVLEVKFLSTLVPQNATSVCNEILNKCLCLDNIKLENILLPDREYLIFWIRLNSFTQSNGYDINIGACKHCNKAFTQKVGLGQFDVDYIKSYKNQVYLPDLNITLDLAVPKFNDSLNNITDEVTGLALWIDSVNTFEDKVNFIENMSALDFVELKNTLDDCRCGINHNVQVECPHCHGLNQVKIILNDDSLFGTVNMMSILETISRIAKYAHLQITNDWAWPEVEAEQIIINNMINEENEANQKEIAKAKSQAASARSNVPSVPSIGSSSFSIPHH